jgi:hypothetical protein
MIDVYQPEIHGERRGFEITVEGTIFRYANSAAYVIEVHQSIPESFLSAIADYESGRIVDADRALHEPPPPST